VDGFLILLFGLISINTLMAISVIRYIKGCHPQHGMLYLGQTYWVIIPVYGCCSVFSPGAHAVESLKAVLQLCYKILGISHSHSIIDYYATNSCMHYS